MSTIKRLGTGLICALAIGLLAGCASTSRVVQYNATDGGNLDIQVERTSGAMADQIRLLVNNEVIGRGSVTVVKTSEVVSGTVNGQLVEAQCYVTQGAMNTGLSCDLFVDGNDAGVLRL